MSTESLGKDSLLFVFKWIATLKFLGVDSFPFFNSRYRDGMYAMDSYFVIHSRGYGDLSIFPSPDDCVGHQEIQLLFVNNGQVYFRKILERLSSDIIVLQGYNHDEYKITASESWCKYAMEDKELDIPVGFMKGIAIAFCRAAQVQYRDWSEKND